MGDLTHADAWWEDGGVARGDDALVEMEMSMARYVIDIRHIARRAVPSEGAEVSAALYGATDIGLGGKDGYDDRVVSAGEIYYAHDALATYDAHVTVYAIGLTTVDGDEVVTLADAVVNDLGRDEFVSL